MWHGLQASAAACEDESVDYTGKSTMDSALQ